MYIFQSVWPGVYIYIRDRMISWLCVCEQRLGKSKIELRPPLYNSDDDVVIVSHRGESLFAHDSLKYISTDKSRVGEVPKCECATM